MRPEMKAIADGVIDLVKGYVAQIQVALTSRIESIERTVANLPTPKDGTQGEPGADGEPGAAGLDGVDGKDGMPGADGPPGEKGADGRDGEPGKDGEKGADGKAGADGLPGKDGTPGIDGKSVSTEELAEIVRLAVEKAVALIPVAKDGVDGRDGVDGSAGANGAPGRDAAHIEILPAIDIEKSYPRGTYAKHVGGLWRSFETTTGLKGWECIVDGIGSLTIESTAERGFEIVAMRSSGEILKKAVNLPVMIYRSVFREGEEYERGDTVTWGGSLWHCNEDTREKPSDGSKSWQLAAKRGRDGKDGRDGIDMTKAVKL
jgi:hypothetical protein